MAEVARALGSDVQSVHEVGRIGLSDPEQLRLAGREGRIFVTRNRNDYIRFTVEFYRMNEPHAGVLIVPHKLPSNEPEKISHALRRWEASRKDYPDSFGPYVIDFL